MIKGFFNSDICLPWSFWLFYRTTSFVILPSHDDLWHNKTSYEVTWCHDELWRKVTNCLKFKIKNFDTTWRHVRSQLFLQKRGNSSHFITCWNMKLVNECDELWRFFENNCDVTFVTLRHNSSWIHETSCYVTFRHLYILWRHMGSCYVTFRHKSSCDEIFSLFISALFELEWI